MIQKLPKWIEVGGFILAFIAGSVNAIGLLGFKHEAVSHLTGTSSLLALQIANANLAEISHLLMVMASFIAGAAFSGFVIGNTALKLGRRYSAALLAETALLVASCFYLNNGSSTGHFFASAACGLQNAMTSTYSGAVVRTTHVSGLFTDLGIMFGLMLRGQKPDKRKAILYLILIAGFIGGGIAGALAFRFFMFSALLMPASLSALLSLGYWLYRHKNRIPSSQS